ncbi:MAG: hypothetical protein ABJO67_01565 [Pseudoruegeria sp.]
MIDFPDSSTSDTPSLYLRPPLAALWWLQKGGYGMGVEWENAHSICQSKEGDPEHDIVHALCHLIEGDLQNADYWYDRVGDVKQSDDPATEWCRIVQKLTV